VRGTQRSLAFGCLQRLLVLALLFEEHIEEHLSVGYVWAAYALLYLICGTSVLRAAGRSLMRGELFNEFTLMTLATLAAIALNELPEAVGVMLFYRCGEFFQERAAGNFPAAPSTIF